MRILIFHGYLLGGTGSNVYNARLAAALVDAGHEVHLLCQDRDPFEQEWVDAAGHWDGGELALETRHEPVRAAVYRPDLGGLLPVYVADRYDGIEAKPFPELTDAELDRYLEHNVAAVREVAERVRPDVALANHLVMGPVVLARGLDGLDVPYAVKVHGSALEYTVKPHPRFLPYAREGLAPARAVLVGSRHTAESLWAAMDDPALEARTRLGPPGRRHRRVHARASRRPRGRASARSWQRLREAPAGDPDSSFARDPAAAADALARIDPERDRLVVFVGKLMASKGVDLLLAAWPLVLERVPEAKLVIVGFGAFRAGLEQLAHDIAAGDLDAVRATRSESGMRALLPAAVRSRTPATATRTAAARLPERLVWAGRLDHAELADLLPATEAMVVPSTFPEAFGMVAAEAAACGSLPVVARHSGLGRGRRDAGRGGARGGAGAAELRARPGRGAGARGRGGRLARGARGPARRDARGDGGDHARALLVGGRGADDAGRRAGAARRLARPLNRYDSAPMPRGRGLGRCRRCRAARGRVGLRAQGRRRQPRGRQEELRRQVRLLPRAQARRDHRRGRARTSTRPSSRRARPASARARSRASSTARSSSPRAPSRPIRRPASRARACRRRSSRARTPQDVAAYVASAVAKPGEDKGQLAAAGVQRSDKVAKAEGGKLAIPADPSGGLAYQFGSAEAPAGSLEIDSENESSVDHNIAVEGSGVDEKGPVVKDGGVSKVTADLKAGEYTFYCSVPGHREGGMEGKLTVK